MSEKKTKPAVAEEAVEEVAEAKKPVAKAKVKDQKKEGLIAKGKRKVKENKKPILGFLIGLFTGGATAVATGVAISKHQQKKMRITEQQKDEYSPLDPNV